jgi:hypothetical protein
VRVDRDVLIDMLSGRGPAAEMCRNDLLEGAHFEVMPGLVDAPALESIYRRRAQHLQDHGMNAIAAFEAADALASTSSGQLALAKVESGPSHHFFQLFLEPHLDGLVACLAVSARPTTADSGIGDDGG